MPSFEPRLARCRGVAAMVGSVSTALGLVNCLTSLKVLQRLEETGQGKHLSKSANLLLASFNLVPARDTLCCLVLHGQCHFLWQFMHKWLYLGATALYTTGVLVHLVATALWSVLHIFGRHQVHSGLLRVLIAVLYNANGFALQVAF